MSKQFKAVITDFIKDVLEPEERILGDLAQIVALDAHHEDELVGHIEDADAIMLYHNLSLSGKTIERLNGCKLIVRCGVGCDNVDRVGAARRGIPVANVPDYGTEEVADSAIGMMLAMTRGITLLNSRLREASGPWSYQQAVPLRRLRGRVFAIVGLGRIGTAVAIRAKALGMDVAFFDPYKPDGYDKSLGIRRVETLQDLLKQAFVLSLHCPLTEETRRLIDGRAVNLMPAGSYLVNTARGEIVDTSAIPAAIESKHLAGAGIDVLAHEPPYPFDPLIAAWRNPNHPAYHRVLINPHSAFYSEEGLLDMRTKGAAACRLALLGRPVPTVVNGHNMAQESFGGNHRRPAVSTPSR